MKLRISIPGSILTTDLEEQEAKKTFKKLVEIMMDPSEEKPDWITTKQTTEPEIDRMPKWLRVKPKETERQQEGPGREETGYKYKGFLLIKCQHCGKVSAYCVKSEYAYRKCQECGERTYFDQPLKPAWMNCECGRESRYLTNMEDHYIEHTCIDCGQPVTMEWNEKKKLYQTIKN